MELTTEKQSTQEKGTRSFLSRIFGEEKSTVNAVDFLKSQHREVEALFAEIESSGEQAFQSKNALTAKVCAKLTLHAKLEEKFLYPVVKTLDAKQFFEAEEEHETVKMVIGKLKTLPSSGANFAAKVKVLRELVEHHVKEEENQMFPLLKKELDDARLEDIGQKMQAYTESNSTEEGPRSNAKKTVAKVATAATAKRVIKAVKTKTKTLTKTPRTKAKKASGKGKKVTKH